MFDPVVKENNHKKKRNEIKYPDSQNEKKKRHFKEEGGFCFPQFQLTGGKWNLKI